MVEVELCGLGKDVPHSSEKVKMCSKFTLFLPNPAFNCKIPRHFPFRQSESFGRNAFICCTFQNKNKQTNE